jgi:methyl-accepting chemotaxis protein
MNTIMGIQNPLKSVGLKLFITFFVTILFFVLTVANEVRILADQSRDSIGVEGRIIENIQMEIEETVEVLSDARPIFQEQIQSVKKADIIFNQIQTHMSVFSEQLSEVSDSIMELDQSQLVLSTTMSTVSAVAEESLATSEEGASLSTEQLSISEVLVRLSDKLEQLSNSVKESLTKFRV